jgi:putative ABC transport system permease protein
MTLAPRWRKVLRDAWLHRSRTLLVIVAIAVGIAGAGTVLNSWALVRRVTREGYLASNPPSATIRTDSIDAELLARVLRVDNVRDARARRTVLGAARAQGVWATAMLFALDDFSANRIGKLETVAGAWPPPDGAFVIERSSVDFSGAALGDPIAIAIGEAEPVSLPVTGVARDVGLAPGWMEHVVYGFVTGATLERLGLPGTFNELQIVVDAGAADREAVRRTAWAAKAAVEATGRRVYDVDVPVPGEHIHAGQMNSLLYTQGAFGVLALLLSGFLVVNLIAAMLAGQVREIGVMKVLGAGPRQVAGLYLTFAAALGLVAGALALPVAAEVGYRYAQLKAELLDFDLTGYTIPRWVLGLELAVALLFPVAAAAIPVTRGSRIAVGDALRDVGLGGHPGGGRVLARASGVARPLLLSIRNAFRRRQRMVLTLLALATGGAVYLGALNLRAAIQDAVDLVFAPQRFDLTLRLMERHPPGRIESAVRRIPGVAAAEAWSVARAGPARDDGTLGNAFPIIAPPAASRMMAPEVSRGRWLQPGDGYALVVNRGLVHDDPRIDLGATVDLVIAGRRAPWTVVGVVDGVPAPTAYAPRETLAPLAGDGGVDMIVVDAAVDAPGAQLDLIQRLRADLIQAGFTVSSSQRLDENRRVIEDHLLMVADFLGIMAWLMIVVGGLGLASTMSLAVLERTREIGVLRAIGARHRSILTIVQVEGLVIGVLSWAIAVPLSLPMSVALGQAFGRIMIPVPLRLAPEPAGVGLWLLVVVGVSLAATLWPAARATRIPTAAALAYE